MPLTIVFVERKNRCNEVAQALADEGVPAVALHGGLSQVCVCVCACVDGDTECGQLQLQSVGVLVLAARCRPSPPLLRLPALASGHPPPQYEREAALRDFSAGTVRALVATDVASRGLDVKGIGHVINMDLPRAFEDYVHRIGEQG
jgi:ATP-dependent RNA helicase DDX5/DBP2